MADTVHCIPNSHPHSFPVNSVIFAASDWNALIFGKLGPWGLSQPQEMNHDWRFNQ